MKRVLIITPYFAPQSHAAVFRAYKLAKYLPDEGWDVHVLTVDTNYLYNEDETLTAALPEQVNVHTAPYVEPTLRGLRYKLGLGDRRFPTLKKRASQSKATSAAGSAGPEPRAPAVASLGPRLRSAYATALRRVVHIPDAYWPWYRPALRKAQEICSEHSIPIVMTSANPYVCHALGRALQRSGLKWVADLRDAHTHSHHMHSQDPWVFAFQHQLERAAAFDADAITVAAESIGLVITENYGLSSDRPIHFIPTGADEALMPPVDSESPLAEPYLLFAGEWLVDYGTQFLRMLARALEQPDIAESGLKLIIVGRKEVNRGVIGESLKELGLTDRVEFIDHLAQQELYRWLKHARFAVLPYSRRSRWWCLPAKLVDYIAMRRPVLALLPNPSEARARLQEAGLGVFLDGDAAAGARTLIAALRGADAAVNPVPEVCDRYLARQQVRAFSTVFGDI